MKKRGIAFNLFLSGLYISATACAWFQSPAGREITKDTVDVLCVLAKAELPVPAIVEACPFAEALTAEERAARVVAIIAAHKAAAAREHIGACPQPLDHCDPWCNLGKDAGADSAADAAKDAK